MRHSFRFDPISKVLMSLLGLGPRRSWIEVTDSQLNVRMGWAFRLRARKNGVVEAAPRPSTGITFGVGVHGWRGTWVVNGAIRPAVEIRFEPRQRAWMMFIPLRVRTLRVSSEDPNTLIEALRS